MTVYQAAINRLNLCSANNYVLRQYNYHYYFYYYHHYYYHLLLLSIVVGLLRNYVWLYYCVYVLLREQHRRLTVLCFLFVHTLLSPTYWNLIHVKKMHYSYKGFWALNDNPQTVRILRVWLKNQSVWYVMRGLFAYLDWYYALVFINGVIVLTCSHCRRHCSECIEHWFRCNSKDGRHNFRSWTYHRVQFGQRPVLLTRVLHYRPKYNLLSFCVYSVCLFLSFSSVSILKDVIVHISVVDDTLYYMYIAKL